MLPFLVQLPEVILSMDYSPDVLNVLAGSLGVVVQIALLGIVYLLVAPTRGRALGLLYAALVAVDGYALVASAGMLVGVPWQITNGVLALGIVGALANGTLRSKMTQTLGGLVSALRTGAGAVTIVGLLMAVQVGAVVLLPEVSIDGQLYHGPVLAQIAQHGTLWGWQAPNQYMYYTDLTGVSAINLATFTGEAVFDNGAQLPHFLILILAVNAGLRTRFARSWVRVSFAALIVSAPVIWIQPRILYVDVAYGAAVAAALVLIATTRHRALGDVLIISIAIAAVIAIKPTGILTGAVLLVAAVGTTLWFGRHSGRLWQLATATAAPILLSMSFYVRNAIASGNPVYPISASLGPLQLHGIVDFRAFASGDRGSGFVDPMRILSYFSGLLDGVLHGVVKADYDPRSGGFGRTPALIVGIAAAILIAQAVWRWRISRPRDERSWDPRSWLRPAALALLAGVILLVQPSTFDARYVIGPTVILAVCVLMSTLLRPPPPLIDALAASVAIALAFGQVAWTELRVFGGASTIAELRQASDEWQPMTPGNPWGRGHDISWLPWDAGRCFDIALQTRGGLTRGGLLKDTRLATLPYPLYGPALCNTVTPVQLGAYEGALLRRTDPVGTADYLVLFADDVARWRAAIPVESSCWATVGEILPTDQYPRAVEVFRNECR